MSRKMFLWAGAILLLAGGMYYLGVWQDTTEEDSSAAVTTSAPSSEGNTPVQEESAGFEVDTPLTDMLLSLKGSWQSDSDLRLTREFKIDKTLTDTYVVEQNTTSTEGYFSVYTGDDAPSDAYTPLDKKGRYLTIMTKDGESLHYQIMKLTSTKLELLYLDHGGTVSFTKIR